MPVVLQTQQHKESSSAKWGCKELLLLTSLLGGYYTTPDTNLYKSKIQHKG